MALFPNQNPPMIPSECQVDEACIWLLAVMDEGDKSRRFIALLLTYFLDRGWLSEKQMTALQDTITRVARKHSDGELECQGASPAKAKKIIHGKVIPAFGLAEGDDFEVLE